MNEYIEQIVNYKKWFPDQEAVSQWGMSVHKPTSWLQEQT